MRSTFAPADAEVLFRGLDVPWWIAGGWALDLFLGRQTRPHEDLDVAILRRDLPVLRRRLASWDLHLGHGEGVIEPGALEEMPADKHAIWCRPSLAAPWAFELLLNEAEGEEWRFRRAPAVARPLARIGARTAEGIPFLAPEVVLLYKAKARRPVDEADLARVAPRLDAEARAWLQQAIALAHPGHPWLASMP